MQKQKINQISYCAFVACKERISGENISRKRRKGFLIQKDCAIILKEKGPHRIKGSITNVVCANINK